MRTSVNYAVVPYIMKWLAEATAILHITLLIRIAVNIIQNITLKLFLVHYFKTIIMML